MLRQKKKIFFLLLFFFSSLDAAIPASQVDEDKKLLEELTGHQNPQFQPVSPKPSLAIQHLKAGLTAKKNGDFKKALQHFNMAIAKRSKNSELKKAYLEKAQLYRLMNLPEQANHNEQLAEKVKNTDVQ